MKIYMRRSNKEEKKITNEDGEYINCAFHVHKQLKRNTCNALSSWYNIQGVPWEHCKGCPFFKTQKRLDLEEQKRIKRLAELEKEKKDAENNKVEKE